MDVKREASIDLVDSLRTERLDMHVVHQHLYVMITLLLPITLILLYSTINTTILLLYPLYYYYTTSISNTNLINIVPHQNKLHCQAHDGLQTVTCQL